MRITSLARSVAPWHPASAWALFASFVVLVGASVAHGPAAGARGAIAVFLAWAIARELAPRRALPSLLAPFAGVAFAIPGETDLLACFAALLAARIAARSVGDPPTRVDRVLLVPFAGWVASHPVGLPASLVLAAICFADEHRARARATGVLMLAAALLVGATEGTLTLRPELDDASTAAQVLLATTVAAAAWLLLAPIPRRLRSRDDRGRGRLEGHRVRAARVATVAVVAAAVAWTGTDGAFALSSASAAVLAVGLGGGRLPPARHD